MSDDRRRFSRIPFDAPVMLSGDNWHCQARLLDISLRGLLVIRPADWNPAYGKALVEARIELSPGCQIVMQIRLAHAEDDMLGFLCEHIDLDSISHLRRLVALNLGDEALLERELGALL
ncbi:MAG: PilZ domain-containing protein [Halopseudomonas yangmingensis]|uniref:Cyclic diguanosine monophosphate-binding protein n=1 Tax=Halopseudomonas yangmingensis TaxID=1720063 RepID=A0A1I4PW25_9GAMM|nr:PilZ domain-containing protein [Halopseudomonas yangmingensis]SFM31690.1 PilZ domain-containing protein [Halopseudomonas yangmingensis]